MHVVAPLISPLLILFAATLWTVIDFRLHPVRDLQSLPWPARRSLYESVIVLIVWIVVSTLYLHAFRARVLYQGLGVGFTWGIVTLYCSTLLRQRALEAADRERWG